MFTRLLILTGLVAATLAAAPTQYNITFTQTSGNGPVPTDGSFLYDEAAPLGAQFTAFSVTWGGGDFDFLSALPGFTANDPNVPVTSCLADTSASTFLLMSGPLSCDPAATRSYNAFTTSSGQQFMEIKAVGTNPDITIRGAGPVLSLATGCLLDANPSDCPSSAGTFSISLAAPEPSTWLLTFGGLGLAAILRRRR